MVLGEQILPFILISIKGGKNENIRIVSMKVYPTTLSRNKISFKSNFAKFVFRNNSMYALYIRALMFKDLSTKS